MKLIVSPDKKDILVLDATELFEVAGRHLSAKRYRAALSHYDRLLQHFPKTRYTSPALYNAGLAHEALLEYKDATSRYGQLMALYPKSRGAVDAGFRLGGCLGELADWEGSAQLFSKLLARRDLSAGDRVEAYARKGLALYNNRDLPQAEAVMAEAIAFAHRVETVERLDNDFFLAMAHYYLGAAPHLRFRLVKVDGSKKMGKRLDAKAKLLLVSQARYIRTIRVKNPYWATVAGFQIGSLYKEFYTTLMTALPDFKKVAAKNALRAKISPEHAERQLVQVYLEEVHKQVKPLLEKAIRVFEKTVVMGERVGIRSQWVQKSQRQMSDLKRLIAASPSEAIKLLPKQPTSPEDQSSPAERSREQIPGSQPPPPASSQPLELKRSAIM
ncbi:MAG: tetratricopeptide repeat protein [Deltaproteobacteria bacterium]|nr:tetratricopeptide repeat protein [Deltaproteobacteria bacterium]